MKRIFEINGDYLVQKCPDLARLAPPGHALRHLLTPSPRLHLPRAKRATRETADHLWRFPAASLRRARRNVF
ncbi:hypothetical protein L3X38_012310 [Prunus dulcis]|uniref:Uncharacterized protein n=1 Tax=Prunus dulcis TaxID=3755 RepID=A0AAD4WJ20_PRUDU|nr:hypothetical protein L3X38_012310 [Prunus dulcis]